MWRDKQGPSKGDQWRDSALEPGMRKNGLDLGVGSRVYHERMESPKGAAKSEFTCAAGAVVGLGSAATAAAVSACCTGPALGPLVISLLGASGAVALEGLRPYTIPLLVLSGLAIGVSLLLNARRVRWLLWLSALAWVGSLASILWARLA